MEAVCERENCKQALRRVKADKGSPGIDGMTVLANTPALKLALSNAYFSSLGLPELTATG